MNQLSIDRRISRCKKKQLAAEKEVKFYARVGELHKKTASCFLEARESLDNALRLLTEPEQNSYPEMVFIELSTQCPWENRYNMHQSTTDRLIAWSIDHQKTSTERQNFYFSKFQLLNAKIDLLELQKGYEQQPAA